MIEAATGYYIESDAGQPWPEHVWCWPCSQHMERHHRKRRRMRGVMACACWGGDDSVQHCAGCDCAVNTGGLSEYAVREEMAVFLDHGVQADDEPVLHLLASSLQPGPQLTQVEAWLHALDTLRGAA